MQRKLKLAAALAFPALCFGLGSAAQAASGSITVKDAGGVTRTFDVVVDGSGNYVSEQVICDQVAAAQCASVTTSNALVVTMTGTVITAGSTTINGTVSGSVTANAGTGTFTISGFATVSGTVNQGNSGGSAWLVQANAGTGTFTISGFATVSGVISQGSSGTSPWPTLTAQGNSGTSAWPVLANAGTGTFTVSGFTTISGLASQGSSGTSPWLVQANAGTGTFTISGFATTSGVASQGSSGTSQWPVLANAGTGTFTVSGFSTISGLVSQGSSGTSPWLINLADIGGASYSLGSTTSGSAAPMVVASDQSVVPGFAAPGCAGQTISNTIVKVFSNGGSSANLLLITGTANQKAHICAIHFAGVAATVNFALVEGTTTTNACDTTTSGLLGGNTANTGENFITNEAMTYGNGQGEVAVNAVASNNVCMLFNSSVQVSGAITYAKF